VSTIIQIADAVVAQLNAATFSQPLTAARHYVPSFELAEMNELRVTVVPRAVVVSPLDRSRLTHDAQVDVAVQKKLATGEAAEIDPLMALVEEVADHFRQRRLDSFPAAHWIRTEHKPIYAQDHWEELRQFTSVVTLTFRVAR
jgi:hypothetical protein